MENIKAIFLHLSFYGLIECSGQDIEKFLQGQITANILDVTEAKALFSAYCDHKGRIISSFYVLKKSKNYYLCLPKSMIEKTLLELNKFAIFSKVKLEDVSTSYFIYGSTQGDIQNAVLLPGNMSRYIYFSSNLDSCFRENDGVTENINDSLNEHQWLELDIQNKIVMIEPETSEIFIPHQLNYQDIPAISFNKGCYRGQEIIARMHYLGKLKQHLYACKIEAPNCGLNSSIIDNKGHELGQVVARLLLKDGYYSVLATLNETLIATDKNFSIKRLS